MREDGVEERRRGKIHQSTYMQRERERERQRKREKDRHTAEKEIERDAEKETEKDREKERDESTRTNHCDDAGCGGGDGVIPGRIPPKGLLAEFIRCEVKRVSRTYGREKEGRKKGRKRDLTRIQPGKESKGEGEG